MRNKGGEGNSSNNFAIFITKQRKALENYFFQREMAKRRKELFSTGLASYIIDIKMLQ
jgi:hypothetical protein